MERNENKSKLLNVSELKCETSILFVGWDGFFLQNKMKNKN